jgi:protein-S-isoprenylcysteine O-methyltransferase Ste14
MRMNEPCAPHPILEKSGQFFFRFRNVLFPMAFGVMMIVSRPGTFPANTRARFFLNVLGVAFVAAGQAYRLVVIGYAYIKRGGKDGKVYADTLVVKGFYAHSRNPMYLGNILMVAGFILVYASPGAYLALVPFFAYAYWTIVIAEERYLRQHFPAEYGEYAKTVNRFIPNFRGLKKSLEDFRYDWKRALRKDYGQVFQAAGMIVLIQFWKCVRDGSLTWLIFGKYLAVTLVLIGIYSYVRWLKKSERLASVY